MLPHKASRPPRNLLKIKSVVLVILADAKILGHHDYENAKYEFGSNKYPAVWLGVIHFGDEQGGQTQNKEEHEYCEPGHNRSSSEETEHVAILNHGGDQKGFEVDENCDDCFQK